MNEETKTFIRECVIQLTMDDYENIATLAPEISALAKKENQPYSFEAMADVLQDLTNGGLLKSYSYSEQAGKFIRTEFTYEALHSLWFLAAQR